MRLIPKAVNFLGSRGRSRTETGRQPRENANTAAGMFCAPPTTEDSSFFFATFLRVTKELRYYGEYVFRADGFPTLKPRQRLQSGLHVASRFVLRIQVHVSTREDHQRGSCGPADLLAKPKLLECFVFAFMKCLFFVFEQCYMSCVSHNLLYVKDCILYCLVL